MKSYTDITQSKKLAEILPIESADMFYNEEPDEAYPKDIVDTKYPMVIRKEQKHYLEEYGIPCWSLAALLEQFEDTAGLAKEYGLWFCYDNRKSSYTKHYDNPVDACVEMIIKLHEKS